MQPQQKQLKSSSAAGNSSVEQLLNPPLRFLPVAFGTAASKSKSTGSTFRGTARAKELDAGGSSSGSGDNSRSAGTLPLRSREVSSSSTSPPRETPGAASEALYRGSFPRPRHLAFLRRLGLRTIVSLTPKSIEQYAKEDEGSAQTLAWCREQGVKVVHIKCEKAKEVETIGISPQAALEAIRVSVLDTAQSAGQVSERSPSSTPCRSS
jgi:Tyrosine phosphatase family